MSTKSVWTPANIVTCVRVVAIPLWLILAAWVATMPADGVMVGRIVVFVSYALIALTDKLDGYLARSRNEVTTFGKFLDPIADKLVVVFSMLFLMHVSLIDMWPIAIVVTREFLVSGLRMVVSSAGTVVAASNLGKWKTATTMTSISCYLLYWVGLPSMFSIVVLLISQITMLAALVLTIWSGVDYFVKCSDTLFEGGAR